MKKLYVGSLATEWGNSSASSRPPSPLRATEETLNSILSTGWEIESVCASFGQDGVYGGRALFVLRPVEPTVKQAGGS